VRSMNGEEGLEAIGERIRAELAAKYGAREKALPLAREVIRFSANGIRAIHREEFELARELLEKAREALAKASAALSEHADIFYAGFIFDAQKEYAEGRATLALVAGERLPSPEDLGVGNAAYLNGLGEAVGELRRHLLDQVRLGEMDRGESLLMRMDDIYTLLVTMDFPDAMTGGLRRTTDVVRGILEKTRGDLTVTLRQSRLERSLADFEGRVKGQ